MSDESIWANFSESASPLVCNASYTSQNTQSTNSDTVGPGAPSSDIFASTVVVTSVVNAASFRPGSIAPGEIVTIFGQNIGSPTRTALRVEPTGLIATNLADTRVTFDGVLAPLIHVRNDQLVAVVPYSLAGKAATELQVDYKGSQSLPFHLDVAGSAPGIFTSGTTDSGQAAALNQDHTVNSPFNPARAGSVVALFATGEGETDPGGVDGQAGKAPLPKPRLPVTVRIAGRVAEVLYAGAAPDLVAGIIQVNVRVPDGISTSNPPVVITVGGVDSQAGVTISVNAPAPSPENP